MTNWNESMVPALLPSSNKEVFALTKNGERAFSSEVGSLHNEVFLTLQTRHAQNLIRGRVKSGNHVIRGLTAFADRVRLIWTSAAENDPYADWWLIKIDEALLNAENRIALETRRVDEVLQKVVALELTPTNSKDPFHISLSFATPYAFRAARVLGLFDKLVVKVLTVRHIGAIDTKPSQTAIRSSAHRIRSAFALPFRYRHLGIRRDKPETWAAFGNAAETVMGILPPDVKRGTLRAPMAPVLHRSATPENTTFIAATDASKENDVEGA